MNHFLAGTRVYLAGPVEHDPGAVSWRQKITDRLTPFGVTVYDPLVKPTWLDPICKLNPQLYRQALSGKSNELTVAQVHEANIMMRRLCMKFVTSCDWIICYHPKTFTVGTFEEIFKAAELDKPVLFCAPDGILSTWALPVFSTPETQDKVWFNSWDSMFEYLTRLHNGDEKADNIKWMPVTYPPAIK